MAEHTHSEPDYGTGQKKLNIYVMGMVLCIVLTLLAFWAVMSQLFSTVQTIAIIYTAAFVQFFIQIICFLRLNIKTVQGQFNVIAFVYTGVILVSIFAGSLWIMYNLNYYMGH